MRSVLLLVALAVLVAACGETTEPTGEDPPSPTAEGIPEGPSALEDMAHPEFPEPLVEPEQIISGGPPPDGIPPIDDPQFVSVDEADEWLEPDEPVVILEMDDDVRAYPVQILMWHEIVNDRVGGVPVTVTYCPLCNTAVSFERVVRGEETTFGTSGRLFASALVMYDRATESLWTHFDGRAVVGVLTGEQLEIVPSPLIAWSEFVANHPDGEVLDRERTGHNRAYGTNPYAGYDRPDNQPFLFRGDVDERARAMQRIVGVEHGEEAKAWSLDAISEGDATVTHDEIGGEDLVILWKAGQSTALEGGRVDAGRDVGSVGVFLPRVDERSLTFRAEDGEFVDEQTGSTWTVAGQAVDGELAGESLERIHHFDTFWFAWSTYRPETTLIEEPAS